MLRIQNLTMMPRHTPQELKKAAARVLGIRPQEILSLEIVKKSLDARKKSRIQWVYTVDVSCEGPEQLLLRRGGSRIAPSPRDRYTPPRPSGLVAQRPVIAGFGPAGMFAALVLAEAGLRPIILERGQDVQTRQQTVSRFWQTGELDACCNVQFGEGGAGAFSDGKLNTGTSDPRHRWILEQFVAFGAQQEILYDAKPHIGTDVLLHVVQHLRQRVQALGGEIFFGHRLEQLHTSGGCLHSITVATPAGPETLPCSNLILATGHSARDTFRMLCSQPVSLEPKPFAMGVRVEHLQRQIDLAQYGICPGLPPADYKLFCHLPQRTVYTFCMCPGGYVVAAASEPGGIVTNGMSYSGRKGQNANSALLVSLNPRDFPDSGPLGGMLWQETLERNAFRYAGNYHAPAQTVGDFLRGRRTEQFGRVQPTYRPGVTPADLAELLPEPICSSLREGLPLLAGKLSGFADPETVLTGPETRSSSPVRILRDSSLQAAVSGLYPCGEGAGYAGGILSAAADGIRCAEAILWKLGG